MYVIFNIFWGLNYNRLNPCYSNWVCRLNNIQQEYSVMLKILVLTLNGFDQVPVQTGKPTA